MLRKLYKLFRPQSNPNPQPQFAPGAYAPDLRPDRMAYIQHHVDMVRERFHPGFSDAEIQKWAACSRELSQFRATAAGLGELAVVERLDNWIVRAMELVDARLMQAAGS